ncbi:MAG: hypothetical protein QOJ42_2860 [Acidobacteriaceae bacterium]|nr:hypothetical protein [Acidobacteriaceae bacterium]
MLLRSFLEKLRVWCIAAVDGRMCLHLLSSEGRAQNLRSGVARATIGENEKGAAKGDKAKNKIPASVARQVSVCQLARSLGVRLIGAQRGL